jgi:hypothetical protein
MLLMQLLSRGCLERHLLQRGSLGLEYTILLPSLLVLFLRFDESIPLFSVFYFQGLAEFSKVQAWLDVMDAHVFGAVAWVKHDESGLYRVERAVFWCWGLHLELDLEIDGI